MYCVMENLQDRLLQMPQEALVLKPIRGRLELDQQSTHYQLELIQLPLKIYLAAR